eukprot:EG_transcript_32076
MQWANPHNVARHCPSLRCGRWIHLSRCNFAVRDPYAVLGVPSYANQEDIKAAFRRLAKQCHPDVNSTDPNSHNRFRQINEAYELIGDEARRREYDAAHDSHAHPDWPPGPDPSRTPPATDMDAFEAFLRGLKGSPTAGPATPPPEAEAAAKGKVTASVDVRLTFLEAARGCTKEVQYTVRRAFQGRLQPVPRTA